MKRGELYRVRSPTGDVRRARVFVVVSRQELLGSRHSTVICAPVYSRGEGLATQVLVGTDEGLKHESWIMCDSLVSLPKAALTDYVGSLRPAAMLALGQGLRVALDLA
jgi:mRNA interferase MazF